MQGGQMVYYYYSLACPGNNPVMYVSTTPIAQFYGGCVAGGCAGNVVVPTIAKPTPVPMPADEEAVEQTAATPVIGSDDPPKLRIERNTEFNELNGLAGRGHVRIEKHQEIIKPEFNSDVAVVSLPVYVEVKTGGPNLKIKAFPIVIDPAGDENLTDTLDGLMVPVATRRLEQIAVGYQFQGGFPKGVVVKEVTWANVTKLDANGSDVKDPTTGNHIPSADTFALSFELEGVTYLVVTSRRIPR
jgi:hypothetical protein